ncbi:MAG TPA: rod shape-determining protein MreD [Trebonia sp.]
MTSEPSVLRRALATVALVVALFAAVVIQLTVVNRLPLPGATQPDLVLLLVTAIAVATGPATGAIAGFAAGLALDVAPPTAHYAGEYALIFCLAGYAAARAVRAIRNMTGERDPIIAYTVMAVATAAGEAGKAAIGMLLSDPDVTAAAVTRVLPGAILYNLLLSPFVFWLVARIIRVAAADQTLARGTAPGFGAGQRIATVFRSASVGAAPKLRLAGTGADYHRPSAARRVPKLRLAGTGADHYRPSAARRVPKLRLSDGRAGSSLRTTAAGTNGTPFPLAGGRAAKLNFGGDLPGRAAARTVRTPGKHWLRAAPGGLRAGSGLAASGLAGSGLAGSGLAAVRGARIPRKNWLRSTSSPAVKRAVRSPSRGWLRASGGAKRTGGVGLIGGRTGAGRFASSPSFPRPARSGAEALAARSAPSGLSALSGPGTPLASRSRARTHSPQAGWLRSSRTPSWAAVGRRLAPRRGWMGSTRRPRTVVGSTVRRNGYTASPSSPSSPSGAWLRRSNRSWHKRRQRLLQLVGVSR